MCVSGRHARAVFRELIWQRLSQFERPPPQNWCATGLHGRKTASSFQFWPRSFAVMACKRWDTSGLFRPGSAAALPAGACTQRNCRLTEAQLMCPCFCGVEVCARPGGGVELLRLSLRRL